jgi:hypothetical protein
MVSDSKELKGKVDKIAKKMLHSNTNNASGELTKVDLK